MSMNRDSQKPSHYVTFAGPLRISSPPPPPWGLAATHSNYTDTINTSAGSLKEKRIPDSSARKRALEIPEIVLLIQEQLDRPSLLVSLRITSLWHQVGRHLVWHAVDWDNTTNNITHSKTAEDKMVENSHRIRTLRCMFHSQAGTSYVDSSALLRTLLTTSGGRRGEGDRVRTKNLRTLSLRGHFSLQSIGSRLVSSTDTTTSPLPLPPSAPRYIPFLIPSLAHLDIRPSVSSAVDLHLILDTAIGLRTLVVDSHGSFIDSNDTDNNLHTVQTAPGAPQGLEGITPEQQHHVYPVHEALVSLKIQHLKMSRQELEGVAARCPNLVEFQSLSSPATLWRSPPGSLQQQQQQQQHHQQQQQQEQLNSRKSLVSALAKSCPKIQRFHVGLQQGGFHTDLVRDTLTFFPRLISFGLPTTDCTRATLDVIKAGQLRHHSFSSSLSSTSSTATAISSGSWTGGMEMSMGGMLPPIRGGGGAFLTSLTIMNVSSSEKVSQALHEFLCWTPYLKEFYAYNTTLYLEHMQSSASGGKAIVETQEPSSGAGVVAVPLPAPAPTMLSQQEHYPPRRSRSSSSSSGRGGSGGIGGSEVPDVYVRMSDHESGSEGSEYEGRTGVTVSHPVLVDTTITSSPLTSSTPVATPIASSTEGYGQTKRQQQQQQQQQRRWACTGLETLVVRFAHLPWRNNTEPPKRSKETFAFLTGLQSLKKLCIKEGLMLESGREYEMLAQLSGLEEVVFTTCYPIPIKAADLEWIHAPPCLVSSSERSSSSLSMLKRVVVRRQKANAVLDRELMGLFEESKGRGKEVEVKLSLQLTDCSEEEYCFV